MYKVFEVAENLNVSKTSIYNKLNQNKSTFKGHVKKIKGVKMIDEQGFQMLRGLYKIQDDSNIEEKFESSVKSEPESLDNRLIEELKDRIKYMESQMAIKDDLIKDQSKQLENFQVLLKMREPALLEEDHTKPTTFWNRLFKK